METESTDLATWARRYVPAYFECQPSSFHLWLADQLTSLHATRGTRLNVIAPRGSAKSTWSTFVYPLYAACHNLEPYIILSSDTGNQAEKYLDAIRAEFEGNELLHRDYPHLKGQGPIWRYDRIRLGNGVMIEAVGTGTKLRGRRNRQHRPTLIIADDPQNTGHIISQLQRERSWEWLTKDVCNAGSATTNIIALGTALHRDCIVLKLQQTPGWQSRLFRAIEEWPRRMDLWHDWEQLLCDWENPAREKDAYQFYQDRKPDMDASAVVLWPERESLYDLMSLRASIGSAAFGSEKQGSPVNPAACEWPEEYFDHEAFWFDTWPDTLVWKTLALDPSKGKDSRRGDYSAFVRAGMDRYGVLYLEADLDRRDTAAMVRDGVDHLREFRPDGFAVEMNAYQELLGDLFIREADKRRVPCPLYGIENHVNKLVRIRKLTDLLAQRRIRCKRHSPGTAIMVQQMRDFPVGDHEDGPDALEMAVRMADRLLAEGETEELSCTVFRT